jgi:hypothetical protein
MFNKKKGEKMSMVGVKQRLQEEYDILTTKFSTYYSKINNKYKKYNPNLGFDQLGIKKSWRLISNGSKYFIAIRFRYSS